LSAKWCGPLEKKAVTATRNKDRRIADYAASLFTCTPEAGPAGNDERDLRFLLAYWSEIFTLEWRTS
jgi:hypothetical protein